MCALKFYFHFGGQKFGVGRWSSRGASRARGHPRAVARLARNCCALLVLCGLCRWAIPTGKGGGQLCWAAGPAQPTPYAAPRRRAARVPQQHQATCMHGGGPSCRRWAATLPCGGMRRLIGVSVARCARVQNVLLPRGGTGCAAQARCACRPPTPATNPPRTPLLLPSPNPQAAFAAPSPPAATAAAPRPRRWSLPGLCTSAQPSPLPAATPGTPTVSRFA